MKRRNDNHSPGDVNIRDEFHFSEGHGSTCMNAMGPVQINVMPDFARARAPLCSYFHDPQK